MATFGPAVDGRGPKVGDAASLWNFTPSPGWTQEEAQTLKLLLMQHGIGRWVAILETGLLPGKMVQQLNGQTQRLLGQQSLAAFTGLQVDVDRIRVDNETRLDAQRKSGLIINTGSILSREAKDQLQAEARTRYGLSAEQIAQVQDQIQEIRAKQEALPSDLTAIYTCPLLASDVSTLDREGMLRLLRTLRMRSREMAGALRSKHAAGASGTGGSAGSRGGEGGRAEGRARPKKVRTLKPREPKPPKPPKAPKEEAYASGDSDFEWNPGRKGPRPGTKKLKRRKASSDVDAELEGALEMLEGMGFPRHKALEALHETEGDPQEALDWLLATAMI
ncbi:hypothetical protein H632_c245p0 [Helicosporidium sp. ATCC 50920]|nr:hypothetical protein H632_c245p0 [Helicosporidium sp. ATCC 50920]|eukprot:KDD76388.1 hypothetical protein H632_c245p0 [Helicosporidium sp. ATCC 50920]